ncbi:hypothetical protein AB0J82_27255 [Asanoa sp. NPDC049518]|uniref:hypothetical protein n=1 Tax=unclassified Asanoa TaxID=2685164 RepID=UPI0034307646
MRKHAAASDDIKPSGSVATAIALWPRHATAGSTSPTLDISAVAIASAGAAATWRSVARPTSPASAISAVAIATAGERGNMAVDRRADYGATGTTPSKRTRFESRWRPVCITGF